ncbi:MAG: hypothetical protein ISR74_06405 [Candidatus Thioglobus sp.]|nr:hypothetical protein [Candidatus Thioglobus sp.]
MKTVELKNYTGTIWLDSVFFFEHNDYREDVSVTLYLEGNRVTDYDHCYEIPKEVVEFMIKAGFNMEDVL